MNTAAVKLSTVPKRLLLILPAILLIAATVLAVRWCLGAALSEQTEYKEIGEFAVRLAPDFAGSHYALALVSEKAFSPADDAVALRGYEQAAALSPHDYRFWVALGKMRERAGEAEGAEKALLRAVELAPNYAQVRWTLGNILLRRGEIERAFNEIRIAAEQNPTYAAPAVGAALQAFGANDVDEIVLRIGNSSAARAALVGVLGKDGKFEEALQIWNSFSEDEKRANKESGAALFASLGEAKKFRLAQAVYSTLPTTGETEKFTVGSISNPDFESDRLSTPAQPLPYAWHIPDGAEPAIAFDAAVRHNGTRSLQLAFRSVSGQEMRPIYQTVTVEPGARYRLSLWARAAGLKTNASLRWEVEDAADGKILISSSAMATGDADWQNLIVDFAVPSKTEAVNIRLARAACALPPCALVGRIWFDDFNLQKLDAPLKN